MEQQRTKLPAASSGASSSSSRSIHGSMSSAFLGASSSTRSQQSQPRSSPSLYPPPAPLPGGFASASGSSSSQLRQAPLRRSRPSSQVTHSLPTPFISELIAIRRMGANVFGDLNVQERTRSASSLTIPQTQPNSHRRRTPSIASREFSGFPSASPLTERGLGGLAPPPLQQQQAQPSFSSLQPLPGGNFSGFPLPASQPQHMQPSSSSSNDLRSRSTIFQSSSELRPLPPSLEMPQFGLPPPAPFGLLSQNNGSSTASSTGFFVQHSSSSEMYELPPLPESLQMPLLQQVMQEAVVVAPCLEPEIISLDDDDDGDELSAVVASSRAHGSTSLPTKLEDRLQLVSSGSGLVLSMRDAARGAQTSEAMPTPASVHGKVNNGGSSSSSIPRNFHGPMPMYSLSEEEALRQLSNLLSRWSSTESSSSDQSMGSSVAGSAAMSELASKLDKLSIGGSRSSAGTQMSWNYTSSCVQNSNPVPNVPKLILGGMERTRLQPRQPVLGAGATSSMSRWGGPREHYFSEADMEKINKDNRLKELMKTDSKRVKRILRNRESVARGKVQKANYNLDLQCRADALKMECMSLFAEVQSHQETFDKLTTKNREVEIKLKGLMEVDHLKQALNDELQSELQRMKQLCADDMNNPKSSKTMAVWSASSANGSNN